MTGGEPDARSTFLITFQHKVTFNNNNNNSIKITSIANCDYEDGRKNPPDKCVGSHSNTHLGDLGEYFEYRCLLHL